MGNEGDAQTENLQQRKRVEHRQTLPDDTHDVEHYHQETLSCTKTDE